MTRRRLSRTARRARWTLTAGAAPGIAATAYWHQPWAGAATCLTAWTLIGITRLALRHKPRRRQPKPTPERTGPLEQQTHALYQAYDHTRALIYIGIVACTDTRNPLDRINEHFDNQPWWRQHVAHVAIRDYYATRSLALAAEARAIHHAIHIGARLRNRTHIGHPISACPTLRASPHMAAP